MDPTYSEKQAQQSIPIVDKRAVDDLVINKNSGLPNLIDGFDGRHPELGNVIFREFRSQEETTAARVTYGALIAGLLLEDSQKRVGGSVLGEISEGVVETSLISLLQKSDQEISNFFSEMSASQKELFRGLDVFAKIAGASPDKYRLGGMLMLQVYKYTLERKRFN